MVARHTYLSKNVCTRINRIINEQSVVSYGKCDRKKERGRKCLCGQKEMIMVAVAAKVREMGICM